MKEFFETNPYKYRYRPFLCYNSSSIQLEFSANAKKDLLSLSFVIVEIENVSCVHIVQFKLYLSQKFGNYFSSDAISRSADSTPKILLLLLANCLKNYFAF